MRSLSEKVCLCNLAIVSSVSCALPNLGLSRQESNSFSVASLNKRNKQTKTFALRIIGDPQPELALLLLYTNTK